MAFLIFTDRNARNAIYFYRRFKIILHSLGNNDGDRELLLYTIETYSFWIIGLRCIYGHIIADAIESKKIKTTCGKVYRPEGRSQHFITMTAPRKIRGAGTKGLSGKTMF